MKIRNIAAIIAMTPLLANCGKLLICDFEEQPQPLFDNTLSS